MRNPSAPASPWLWSLWSLAAALLLADAASAQTPLPSSTAATQMSPATLRARFDRTCVRRLPLSRCYPPTQQLIFMYVPVAYVETTRQPGETTVASAALRTQGMSFGDLGRTVSRARSNSDSTSEAHVYTLPDRLILAAGLGPVNMVCTPSDAMAPDVATPAASATLLSRATCGNLLGDVAGAMASQLANAFDGTISEALCTPRPVYWSELDVPNWRTGCGDETISKLMLSSGFTCQAGPLAAFRNVAQPLAALLGPDTCIDHWDALYPRQMRERGLAGPAASAKTAYRAMSLARASFGAFPFPVGLDGFMQQVYPAPSRCFPPGAHVEAMTLAGVNTSNDDNYGWVYWRPAKCCVPKPGAAVCPG